MRLRASRPYVKLYTAAIVVLVAACGGDGADDGTTRTTTPTAAPTLANVEAKVFATSCAIGSSCHKGLPPKGELSLESPTYDALVDHPAAGAPGRVRVKPGDPDGSYLLEKLTQAKPAAGERMPPGQPLDAEKIALVRAWIAAGAPRE